MLASVSGCEQDDASLLPLGLWAELGTGEIIPDGAEVVLTLDGSFNGDSTALLVATVSTSPHLQVGGLWEPPSGQDSYRVPILDGRGPHPATVPTVQRDRTGRRPIPVGPHIADPRRGGHPDDRVPADRRNG